MMNLPPLPTRTQMKEWEDRIAEYTFQSECQPCLCSQCFKERTIEGKGIIGALAWVLLKVESGKWSAKTAMTKFLTEQKCGQENGESRNGGWHNVKHEFAQKTLKECRGDL